MSGKIQEIGIIILKQYKKSNLLIVGQGSIGKKYKKVSKHFFQPSKVQVFSKHLKKTRDKLDKINNSDKNFVILSNKVTERLKYFTKFFKKKTTFLFEKPVSHKTFSKTEERNFYKLINKHDVKIKSGYCLRLNPAVIEAKKRIKNNLHNILTIKIHTNTFLPNWRKSNYRRSVSAKKKDGGGVLNELSHELDLLLHLFGKPRFLFANFFNSKSLKINTEDIADIIFIMNKKLNVNMHLDFCSPFEKREIEVLFNNKKKILLDLRKNIIKEIRGKKTFIKKYYLEKDFYQKKQIEMMMKISNNKKNSYWKNELKDSIQVLRIIKKIKESKIKKKMIKI